MVYPHDSNYVSFLMAVSAGTYTVDWGDGTSPVNLISSTLAQRNIDYNNITSSVTTEGYKVAVITITPTNTDASSMFGIVNPITIIPLTNTQGIATFASTFLNAFSLIEIPYLETSAASTLNSTAWSSGNASPNNAYYVLGISVFA